MSKITKTPVNPLSIAIAGYGKMGEAMAKTWALSPFVKQIIILDPFPLVDDMKENDKVTGFTSGADFTNAIGHCNFLVLAVKPQALDSLCANLRGIPKTLPILSIAAGKKLDYFAEKLGADHPVIRAMPNTPAAIGKGMCVAVPSATITETDKTHANFLLACLGKVEWSHNEPMMDVVTGLSGSGPAYVFYLVEALAKAGMENGLDKDFAMTLARQTVIGAASLLEENPSTPASELRANVTSPSGTTEAALTILMDGRFQSLLNETVAKASERSKELSN